MTPAVEIDLVAAAPVSVGARAWGHRGRYRLTAIVKAAFTLEQDGPMRLTAPSPLVVRDVARGPGPISSSLRTSELALYLRRPEIYLDAIAFAPKGQQVEHMKTRFAVARGDRMLVSKELHVLGDRTSVDGVVPRPVPFAKMPIVYERAFGGVSNADNPVGIGTDSGGRITMPNLMPSEGARAEPPGFGPIAAWWPSRKKKLGTFSRTDAEEAVWVAMPDTFDETFYQAAPIDQQVDDLLPGDVLAFIGMHPDRPTIRAILPHTRGVAIAEAGNGRRVQIPTRLDTVFVEPHLMRAELVFRGVIEMTPEFLRGIRVAGALEEPPTPYTFPPLAPLVPVKGRRIRSGEAMVPATDGLPPPSSPASAARPGVGTVMLDESSPSGRGAVAGTMLADAADPGKPLSTMQMADTPPTSLPFKRVAPTRRRSSMMPRANVVVPAKVVPAHGVLSTMLIDDAPPAAPPPPRAEPPIPPAPPPPAARDDVAPSARATPQAEPPPASAKPKPTDTYAPPDLGEILAKKQAELEATGKAPVPAAPNAAPKPKEAVWGSPTNEAPAPPSAPQAPPPRVQPAPDRKAQLYKKFKT